VVFGDKYIFYRDAYLQHREFLEKDGQVDDPFGEEF
jgi:ABC-type transporter lipoprotein component MlaA